MKVIPLCPVGWTVIIGIPAPEKPMTISAELPDDEFLEYLKAAGVPVCINTDSHKTDTIDFGLDSSMAYAKKAGYDELSYPVEGKIVHIKL